MLCVPTLAQDQPRQLKGGGHLLGETAEQFFSEGPVGDLQRACQEKDWKAVRQLFRNSDATKPNPKDLCAKEKLSRQQAASGERVNYKGQGDNETMRSDTFTFEGSRLVRIHMVYLAPLANVEGHHHKSFAELLAGLQEAYGPPSKSYSEPVLNTYGVKYEAHRAFWMGKQDVISIIEQPGEDGQTEITAETIAEYNRAAGKKAENPLQ